MHTYTVSFACIRACVCKYDHTSVHGDPRTHLAYINHTLTQLLIYR